MAPPTDRIGRGTPLPLVGQPPAERADAARNRRALLMAAGRILAESGIEALTMDRVAAAAGVGVGTVYRRFGDRAGLAFALLDETERRFQQAYLCGPPPLGPGAPPVSRIRAFLHAYADRLETDAELHGMGESIHPSKRYRVGAYHTSRAHLVSLLTSAGTTGDLDYLADALLAPLAAGLFLYQRRELGMSLERIEAGLDRLLDGLLGRPSP